MVSVPNVTCSYPMRHHLTGKKANTLLKSASRLRSAPTSALPSLICLLVNGHYSEDASQMHSV